MQVFKAYKLKLKRLNDTSDAFHEAPVKNEFHIIFNLGQFTMTLIDLVTNTKQDIENLIIEERSMDTIVGKNQGYKVKITYDLPMKRIEQIFLEQISSSFGFIYLGENELKKRVSGETRNKYIIGANKSARELNSYIEEGHFTPMETEFAFIKIRQKLTELSYYDYVSNEIGTLKIIVSFFKDTSIKTHVDIENTGFDLETITMIIDDIYNNTERI